MKRGALLTKNLRRHAAAVFLIFCGALFAAIAVSARVNARSGLPAEVLMHRPAVHRYAVKQHISRYEGWLLSIIEVETGGGAGDVMQSSESEGLRPDSLDTDDSIEQGCRYFAGLLARADKAGTDFDSVLQAYNFGPGYIDYVAAHGGKNTEALAEEFAKEKSGGEKVSYTNPVAQENGSFRYAYGNMYYAILVHDAYALHLEGRKMSRLTRILATAAALQCFLLLFLETFATSSPLTAKLFKMSASELKRKNTGLLFRNQGFYNGLVGVFLLYGAWISADGAEICAVFLIFMAACAVYGAVSGGTKPISLLQGLLPAAALISMLIR